MQAEPARGLRGFFATKLGKVAFVLLAVGIVSAALGYAGTLIAIPVMLLVGLALPIYAGLKRPRFLALAGLVVLVAAAPIATVIYTQELLVPPAAASSAGAAPFESGGAVLQNAQVSPFSGAASSSFTWSVTLYPGYLAGSLRTTNWSADTLELFLSTCPGATYANETYCSGGYALVTAVHAFSNASAPHNGSVVTFNETITSPNIWEWQMELVLQNLTNATNPARIELVGDPTYDGLEGPIVGGFGTAYAALIGTIYGLDLIYLGIPFYFLLLLYVWFKSREARRKAAVKRAAQTLVGGSGSPSTGSAPTSGSDTGGGSPAGSAPSGGRAATAPTERTCPGCGAVVYPNEATCWKCGVSLTGGPAGPPLASGPSPPSSGKPS